MYISLYLYIYIYICFVRPQIVCQGAPRAHEKGRAINDLRKCKVV